MEPNPRPQFFDQFDEPAKTELDRILDDVREQAFYAMRKYPRPKKSAASDTSRPEFFRSVLMNQRNLITIGCSTKFAQMRYAIRKHPNVRAKLIEIINEEEPNESK